MFSTSKTISSPPELGGVGQNTLFPPIQEVRETWAPVNVHLMIDVRE